MKKAAFILSAIAIVCITACNSHTDESKDKSRKQVADSLEKKVLEGHDVTMPKSMKIPDLQAQIKRIVDSIGKLPAKAAEAAAPYKEKLQNVNKELGDAYTSMETWMDEFGERLQELSSDSLKNNFEEKIKYYSQEEPKIDKIKNAVLESVQKAESLLKGEK